MPSLADMGLQARQDLPPGYHQDDFIIPWWHSTTGIIVKWVVFLVIFTTVMLYLIVGHAHARARIRKGLEPLAYHRCLVTRKAPQPQYQQGWPQPGHNYGYYQPSGYPMGNMPPPPTYDPNRPPMYSGPPDGGSKLDPSQATNRPADANPAPSYYAAPPSGQTTGIMK